MLEKRDIYFYGIDRSRTEEALKAALSFAKWYEKKERWEKEKINFADFAISESKKRNICVRMATV